MPNNFHSISFHSITPAEIRTCSITQASTFINPLHFTHRADWHIGGFRRKPAKKACVPAGILFAKFYKALFDLEHIANKQ